ncbi:hypothetical protein GLYMA_18G197850v4 [Glycine max]|nr:hypothetical protein GLYMA_18G197850v4 [Glycine max]KAH1155248.1 hypothetical protein GYH30_050530 [Glycine max]
MFFHLLFLFSSCSTSHSILCCSTTPISYLSANLFICIFKIKNNF